MFLLPGLAAGEVIWRGDFETGNRSQYTREQMVSSDRLLVVTNPVAEGKYALKVTVKQGDDPINSSGNRNELVYLGKEKEGSEYYYRWKVMFAPDFPSVDTWQLFTQWHHDGCCGSPPLEFYVRGEEMRMSLNSDSTIPWRGKLVRGVWHEFILHVKWSAKASTGFVELWHNKEKVLAKRAAATMYAGQNNYLKLGLYRSDTVRPVGVLYHDGFIQATTLADVLPTTPTPDAGTPVDAGTPDSGTPEVDAGTVDAGTPTVDAGTPAADAGTRPDESPGGVIPPGGLSPSGDDEEAVGCNSSGGPLAGMALLGLMGLIGARRRRS
ncbi:heparin lyase I family protein [Myxococcus sp. K38C18041901]|uniref:polysaccharide lyase n=1 Tax=Myxococcus guangdongensis TaxID=2906760 RepID=UPI0020A7B384|nr:heparin lyase I family protein [Myxococcus guangdongensis]MCP3059617.1 heparin lyase I family protein [Myxococcus guangdongensis]